jgi:hypothetical protein
MRIRTILAALLVLCLADAARAADQGKVVLALGAAPLSVYNLFMLKLRRADGHAGMATAMYLPNNPLATAPHFKDPDEDGAVLVLTLSAGDWVIYGATWRAGPEIYRPLAAFEVPFAVEAGRTTYIGDFDAVPTTGFVNQRRSAGGVVFLVSDKRDRDIALAKARDPELGEVEVAIADVRGAHTPVFVAPAPAADAAAAEEAPPACLGACESGNNDVEDFKVESMPAGAVVTTSIGPGCPATPCTLQMPRKKPFSITLTLGGYQPLTAQVKPDVFGTDEGARSHVFPGGIAGALVEAATQGLTELTPNPFFARLEPLVPPAAPH